MSNRTVSRRPFLTAEWRSLVMLNYRVDAELLQPYVPAGTELDRWGGHTYASLVAFRFLRTRVAGVPIPWHTDFDEVNLRFYVRREESGQVKRGVAFLSEVVPLPAVAWLARLVYNEKYTWARTRHQIEHGAGRHQLSYGWRVGGWNHVHVTASGIPSLPAAGSLDQFITEHYWGYSAQRDGGCVEYEVEHVPWRTWCVDSARFEGEVSGLYGAAWNEILQGAPASAFLAEGSPVTVYRGRRLVGVERKSKGANP